MDDKVKVLVVDDEENLRLLVAYNLRLDGFDVLEAESGEAALEKIEKDKPDLVLLDIMMPKMDGFQVLSAIKHEPKYKKTLVFMMTVRGHVHDMDRAFDLGADDYISKPFDPEELGKIIQRKLKKISK